MTPRARTTLAFVLAALANLFVIYFVVEAGPVPSRVAVVFLGLLAMGLAWAAGQVFERKTGLFPVAMAGLAAVELPLFAAYHAFDWTWFGVLPEPFSVAAAGLATIGGVAGLVVLKRGI